MSQRLETRLAMNPTNSGVMQNTRKKIEPMPPSWDGVRPRSFISGPAARPTMALSAQFTSIIKVSMIAEAHPRVRRRRSDMRGAGFFARRVEVTVVVAFSSGRRCGARPSGHRQSRCRCR